MGEVDLREENQISKGDELLQERWDTQIISALKTAQKEELAAIKAAKENS